MYSFFLAYVVLQVSDGLVVMENDQLHLACTKLYNIKKVAFADMNRVIAHHLAAWMLPAQESSGSIGRWRLFGDPLLHLCSHPGYKMLNVKSVPQMPASSIPFTADLWPGLLRRLHQMIITDAKIEEGINWYLKLEGNIYLGCF